jgi:putative ABC transport system permease protein
MKNREIAKLAVKSIRNRSLRSWLAILGIVIGVGSIISLISISTGLNQQIKSNLGGLGASVITISPGAARAERFGFGAPSGGPPGAGGGFQTGSATSNKITFREADALRSIEGVAKVDARLSGNARISYKTKNTSVTVIGVEPAAFPASSANSILKGKSLGTGDLTSVVLGYSVEAETFNESMVGQRIKIDGTTFRVVGVLNQSGSSFGGSDRNVFISQKAAKKLLNQTKYASSVVVIASGGSDPDAVASSLATKLQSLHRVTADTQDFTVTTATTIQTTISSITNTLGIFLGGIASISLIVGGIGVANAMFTSVLEQTRYIGLLKSLGARRGMILKLFLFEASMVGLVGGVIGILLSFLASAALASFGLPSAVTLELVLLGLGFSVAVGAVSGLIPARNAASVEPVEALRYE